MTFTPSDNGDYTVILTAADDDGGVSAPRSATVSVANVAPTLTLLRSAATVDEGSVLDLSGVGRFSDPGFSNLAVGTSEPITYTIAWGDGSSDSGTGVIAAGGLTLAVGGTLDNDRIEVVPSATPGGYSVSIVNANHQAPIFGPTEFAAAPLSSIGDVLVYGQAGDNSISLSRISLPATVYGGAGNDQIEGGSGNDHLFGGPGDDRLSGGPGVNQLDGGDGSDVVFGTWDTDFRLRAGVLESVGTDHLINIEGARLAGGGGDNRLTVDFSSASGGFFARPADIKWDGGAGVNDRLKVIGLSGMSGDYAPSGTAADAGKMVVSIPGSPPVVLEVAGTETVEATAMDSLRLLTPNSLDVLSIGTDTSVAVANNRIAGTSGGSEILQDRLRSGNRFPGDPGRRQLHIDRYLAGRGGRGKG